MMTLDIGKERQPILGTHLLNEDDQLEVVQARLGKIESKIGLGRHY